MNAKFSVGELIVLQSKSMPQYNGEYTVEGIIKKDERHICRLTKRILVQSDDFGYVLSTPLFDLINNDGYETFWAESALRKRQEPGELSYAQLMQSLRSPIYEVS